MSDKFLEGKALNDKKRKYKSTMRSKGITSSLQFCIIFVVESISWLNVLPGTTS